MREIFVNVIALNILLSLLFGFGGTSVLAVGQFSPDESYQNQCECLLLSYDVNCEGKNLSSIPDCVSNNTHYLVLSRNNIRQLLPEMFLRFSKLRVLFLEECGIEEIKEGAFKGLASLTFLSLRMNTLLSQNAISAGAFRPLINLQTLWFDGNCQDFGDCAYPESALFSLPRLNFLAIDGLPNITLGYGFASLTNLQTLRMKGSPGSCYLPYLTNLTFAALRQTHVSVIRIVGCNVRYIEPNVFLGLRNITKLELSKNYHLSLDALRNLGIGLGSTNIEELTISTSCKEQYHVFDNSSLHLSSTQLKRLILSSMNIVEVSLSFVENLPVSLEFLSLQGNMLWDVRAIGRLKRLKHLKILDIGYQFQHPEYQTTMFRLSNHKTRNEDEVISLPENLRLITANSIYKRFDIKSVSFSNNTLEKLDASHSTISKIWGPILGLKQLRYLDISDNILSYIHVDAFSDMTNLQTLLLNDNLLGKSTSIAYASKLFRNLTSLQKLDLASNSIEYLPKDIFLTLNELRQLRLKNNLFIKIDFTLTHLHNLQVLDISNNKIHTITEENLNHLNHLDYLNIYLHGNSIQCTCNNSRIPKWLIAFKAQIILSNELFCTYKNNSKIPFSKFEYAVNQLEINCHEDTILTYVSVCFYVMSMATLVFAALYRQRWKVRYLYHIGKQSLNPYHQMEEEYVLLDTDVYFSYEMNYILAEDVTLHQCISNHVIPFLRANGLTVKVREDITPGRSMSREIVDIIRHSKKVVAVISPDFSTDFWNTFEFNMSVMEGIYTKRDVIVPLLLCEDNDIELPNEIRSVISAKQQANDIICVTPKNNICTNQSVLEQLIARLRQ